MKKNMLASALLLATIGLVSCNNEGDTSSTTTDTSTTTTVSDASTNTNGTASTANLSADDRNFVMEAAAGGMMEVEAGNIAQQNASSQRVKDFAAMMVRDHSKANDELKALAASKNVMLPDSLPADMRQHMQEMQKMKGKSFDNHYMSMMVDDHNKDVSKFEKASNSASDADVKAFPARTLPVLKTHQDSAKAVKSKM